MKKLSGLLLRKRKWLHKQKGYSLFQLGICFALLLILCSISLPRFAFLQHRLVRIEIEKMALMFRYLHRTALALNRDQYLELFTQEGYYQGAGHREYLPSGVCFGVFPGVYGPPSQPQHHVTSSTTYKNGRVIFYAHGTIQPGTIYMTDSNQQVLYALSTAISPFAYIRTYRYSTNREWIAL